MKKFLIFSLALTSLFACTKEEDDQPTVDLVEFTLSATTKHDTARVATSAEVSPKVVLSNTSGKQGNLVWRRINVNTPSTWEVATCDDIACHAPSVVNREMTLAAGATVDMKVSFFHNGEPGTGTAQLLIFDPQDSAATVQIVSYTAVAE